VDQPVSKIRVETVGKIFGRKARRICECEGLESSADHIIARLKARESVDARQHKHPCRKCVTRISTLAGGLQDRSLECALAVAAAERRRLDLRQQTE
jgi:hypothetical protein